MAIGSSKPTNRTIDKSVPDLKLRVVFMVIELNSSWF